MSAKRFGWAMVLAGLGAALLSLLLTASGPLLFEQGSVIFPPDSVMVLSGNITRIPRALALCQQYQPRNFLISGGPHTPSSTWGTEILALARQAGVDPARCLVEDRAHSTYSNFQYMLPVLHDYNLHHILVVSSWYHTRRVAWLARHFHRQDPGLVFSVLPSEPLPSFAERLSADNLRWVLGEWLKLPWYGLRHRLFWT